MDNQIIKSAIAVEKLNTLCVTSNNIKYPVRYVVTKIKEDIISCNDIIDIIYASYFINNCKSDDNIISGITNFIKIFSDNKNYLYDNFINNVGMANVLVSDYRNRYLKQLSLFVNDMLYNPSEIYAKSSEQEKRIVSKISNIYDFVGFNYITDLARFTWMKSIVKIIPEMKSVISKNDEMIITNPNLLKRILVGDAYTYMCYNNQNGYFNNYIEVIEENSTNLNKLWDVILKNKGCLRDFMFYMANLLVEEDYYSEVYKKTAETNPKFKEYLKIINPYYVMDEIRDINIKKYRK